MGFLVVIADPAEIKRVFTSDPDQLRAGEGNVVMQPVAGPESVLLLDGKRHLNRRKLMLPPFHGERMGVYADLIGEIADEEIARWPVGEPFSAHTSMQRITLRVILRAVLGIEDAARGAELERLLPKLLNSPALLWPFLQRDMGARSPWRRFVALRERVDAILFDEIARKRSDPNLAEHEDILSMLLGARDEHGEAMTDEELRDQLVTLLLAGHETTATGLAWIFERVLRTPEVHARLRTAVAEDDDRYLECLIKEGLRLRPVVPLVARQVNAPFAVGDYTVPAGTLLDVLDDPHAQPPGPLPRTGRVPAGALHGGRAGHLHLAALRRRHAPLHRCGVRDARDEGDPAPRLRAVRARGPGCEARAPAAALRDLPAEPRGAGAVLKRRR